MYVATGVPYSQREVLTPDEARQILRVGRNGIYDLIHQGRVRAVRLGRKLVIPRAEINRLLHGPEGTATVR